MWLFIALSLLIPMNLFAETTVIELEVHHQKLAADVSVSGEMVDAIPDSIHIDPLSVQNISQSAGMDTNVGEGVIFPKISVPDILLFAGYIWLAGIVILSIVRVASYRVSLSEIKRWGIAVKDDRVRAEYSFVSRKMGIEKPPKLAVNSSLQSPLLVGVINTRLYLPDISYTDRELMLIFTHELSHFRNRDLWYKTLLMAVNTIYWFNPLIYLMVREAEKDVEYICDSKVVASCSHSDRILYNRLLLKTAAASTSIHYLSASLNDSTTALKERILYMMKAKTLKRGIIPVIVLTITLVASNAVLGCTLKVYATAGNKKVLEEAPMSGKKLSNTSNRAPGTNTAKISTSQKADDTPQKPSPATPAETVPTVTPKETAAAVQENENIPVPTPETTPEPVIVQEISPGLASEPVQDDEPADGDASPENPDDSGQVNGAVQLFEGGYFDNSIYGDDVIEKYFEVGITNITASSFDFTIYEVDAQSGGSEVVFLTNTALFTGDGTTAAYEGEDYLLSFSFPDNHAAYPVVTDMIISGFAPLEGKTLVNNGIPGYEFG